MTDRWEFRDEGPASEDVGRYRIENEPLPIDDPSLHLSPRQLRRMRKRIRAAMAEERQRVQRWWTEATELPAHINHGCGESVVRMQRAAELHDRLYTRSPLNEAARETVTVPVELWTEEERKIFAQECEERDLVPV